MGNEDKNTGGPTLNAGALLDALPTTAALLDPQGVVIAVNERWRATAVRDGFTELHFGVGVDYLAACERAEQRGCAEAGEALRGLRGLLSGQTTEFSTEYACHSSEGPRWNELVGSVVREQGQLRGALVQHRDITRQRLNAQAVRQSEARFRELVAGLSVGVLLQGPGAEILLSNRAALDLLGLTEDQLLGRTSFDPGWGVIHDDGSPFPGGGHPVPVALRTGLPVRGVIMGVARPALRDRVWLLVDAVPEVNADGSVARVVCTFSNITGLRRLQEQLASAQRLDSMARAAGGLAHDFSNLMTALQGHGARLRHSLPEGDPRREHADGLMQIADQATSMIRRLMAVGRQQPSRPVVVSMGRGLRDMEPLLRRLLGAQHSLRLLLGANPDKVLLDPNQLEQVVLNLVMNARDAMPHGGAVELTTSLVEGPTGPCVELRVSDSGTGVAPEHLPHIFEPFFSTKAEGKGTGLGLSTVHGLVTQGGGTIDCESEAGRGTTFVLRFPKEAGRPTASPPAQPPSRETVLLVEDHMTIRLFTEESLIEQGYRVLSAADGPAALALAGAHRGPIDLLLTDVHMPRMTGPRVASELRAMRPDVRVLYVTGSEDAVEARPERRESVLSKPFGIGDLLETVQRVLAS